MYFDQLLGAACNQKLVETYIFSVVYILYLSGLNLMNVKLNKRTALLYNIYPPDKNSKQNLTSFWVLQAPESWSKNPQAGGRKSKFCLTSFINDPLVLVLIKGR